MDECRTDPGNPLSRPICRITVVSSSGTVHPDAVAISSEVPEGGATNNLDIHDLDYQEIRMRQQWEHKVFETKDRAALQPELVSAGAEGWELVSATAMFNALMTKVVYTLFLKRPVS